MIKLVGAAGMLVVGVGTTSDVCDSEVPIEADTALEAIVTSLATCDMVVGIVAAGHHRRVRFAVVGEIARAIGDE